MGEREMDSNHTNGVVHGTARNGTRAIAGAETIQAWLVDRLAELLEIEIDGSAAIFRPSWPTSSPP
jgi:hypothetical protein